VKGQEVSGRRLIEIYYLCVEENLCRCPGTNPSLLKTTFSVGKWNGILTRKEGPIRLRRVINKLTSSHRIQLIESVEQSNRGAGEFSGGGELKKEGDNPSIVRKKNYKGGGGSLV